MLIGVLSDTHKLVRDAVRERIADVDLLIHAGDVGAASVLTSLQAIAPVHAVRGNVDRGAWAEQLPASLDLNIEGVHIHVRHDRKTPVVDIPDSRYDIVICGHSHQPGIETAGETTWLNPGSAGPRRFSLPVSLALLTVSAGEHEVTLITLQD